MQKPSIPVLNLGQCGVSGGGVTSSFLFFAGTEIGRLKEGMKNLIIFVNISAAGSFCAGLYRKDLTDIVQNRIH